MKILVALYIILIILNAEFFGISWYFILFPIWGLPFGIFMLLLSIVYLAVLASIPKVLNGAKKWMLSRIK